MPSAREAPASLNFEVWVVNHILLYRVGVNTLASELDSIPRDEARLRNEVFIPYYSFARNVSSVLKSIAYARGVVVPTIPDAPEDWNEEVSTDYKALAAQLRPHVAEPAKATMDWIFSLRDGNPKLHWASRVAVSSMSLDLFIGMMSVVDATMGGSEWHSFVAQATGDELKGIAAVMREEILRIRAQPGSGWDEEEAKRAAKEQLDNLKEAMKVGTLT